MKRHYMPLNSKSLTSVSILSNYTDTHLHLYLNKQFMHAKKTAMTLFISLIVFQCFINLNNLKWTQNVQPTVCTMIGVSEAPFPSNLTQCIRCVSLGNVGPACIQNREKTCPGNLPSATGRETSYIKRGRFLPADVFSGTHMAGRTAGYVRAHAAWQGSTGSFNESHHCMLNTENKLLIFLQSGSLPCSHKATDLGLHTQPQDS